VDKLKNDHTTLSDEVEHANTRHREVSSFLEGVQTELNEARSDKHESARHQKRKEVMESMKRLFPGVYGRLIDLCEPAHKK
jgi:structural maintenance of chromosome 1